MRKRNYGLHIFLNEEEYLKFTELAKETGLSRSQLFRYIILGFVPVQAPPADYKTLIRELRAVGNNLNQILVIARTNGILNVPDLRKAISDLREVEMLMREAFTIIKKI